MRNPIRRFAAATFAVCVLASCDSPAAERTPAPATPAGTPAPDEAPSVAAPLEPNVDGDAWQALEPGDTTRDFALGGDGALRYAGEAFAAPLPRTDAAGEPLRYRVSPRSPGDRYAFVQGTAPAGTAYLYVADLRRRTLAPTQVLKYGPAEWVAWAGERPYAFLVSRQEGGGALFRIDLASGASEQVDFGRLAEPGRNAAVDEKSFAWIAPDRFTIDVEVGCNPSLERCADSETEREVHRVEVAVPELTWRERE